MTVLILIGYHFITLMKSFHETGFRERFFFFFVSILPSSALLIFSILLGKCHYMIFTRCWSVAVWDLFS